MCRRTFAGISCRFKETPNAKPSMDEHGCTSMNMDGKEDFAWERTVRPSRPSRSAGSAGWVCGRDLGASKGRNECVFGGRWSYVLVGL